MDDVRGYVDEGEGYVRTGLLVYEKVKNSLALLFQPFQPSLSLPQLFNSLLSNFLPFIWQNTCCVLLTNSCYG